MKYKNKRLAFRSGNGQFRAPVATDIGVSGVCECGHLMTTHYYGNATDWPQDPAKRRARCFHCNPLTADEIAGLDQNAPPAKRGMMAIIKERVEAQQQ